MDPQTIATYNKMAQDYDTETIDFWDRFPKPFMQKFLELSGNSILDVGSGPGRDGLIMKKAGKSVICIDASESMVKISKDRGLDSILGSFDSLPFGDATYDGVWSYTALLHTPKKSINKPLEEIARVLKPKGIFALGLIEGDTEGYKQSSGVQEPRWFSFYSREEISTLVCAKGFEEIYFDAFKPGSKKYLHLIFRKK